MKREKDNNMDNKDGDSCGSAYNGYDDLQLIFGVGVYTEDRVKVFQAFTDYPSDERGRRNKKFTDSPADERGLRKEQPKFRS